MCTKVQVWVQAELRGACSGRSKSQNLAINHGVAFRGARAEQDNGKHIYQNVNFCFFALLLYLLLVPHQPSKCVYVEQPRCNSSRASSFPFVTAMNSASVRVKRVRVCNRTQDPSESSRNAGTNYCTRYCSNVGT